MNTGDQIIDAVIRAAAIEQVVTLENGSLIFVWASNASEQIEAALAENAPTCTWTYDCYTGYDSACGRGFYMDNEWAEKFKFCPYCGGRISLASEKAAPE